VERGGSLPRFSVGEFGSVARGLVGILASSRLCPLDLTPLFFHSSPPPYYSPATSVSGSVLKNLVSQYALFFTKNPPWVPLGTDFFTYPLSYLITCSLFLNDFTIGSIFPSIIASILCQDFPILWSVILS